MGLNKWDGIGVLRKKNIICAEENIEAELKEDNGRRILEAPVNPRFLEYSHFPVHF